MSTNPFRRDSSRPLEHNFNPPTSSTFREDVIDIPSADLSVNTRVSLGSTDRHVSFASPPVDSTISAEEYPSSPESTRFSPAFQAARPVLPPTTDYSTAIQSDPFRSEDLKDEDDGAIGEALRNAQTNASLTEAVRPDTHQDAVKKTLSRFASIPRNTKDIASRESESAQETTSSRNTMDVDAFKRLLLTGDSGSNTPKGLDGATAGQTSFTVHDSSSSADTASLSQRSVFDPAFTNAEVTPRSSHEFSTTDTALTRDQVQVIMTEAKKKAIPPPTPTPRRTKSIKQHAQETKPATGSSSLLSTTTTSQDLESQSPASSTVTRKPPTPPLTRRHSHKSGPARIETQHSSSSADPESENNASASSSRATPSALDRRRESESLELVPTIEEAEAVGEFVPSSRKPSAQRPPPPPSRNSSSSAKRASLGMMSPPPVPAPRRGRGSSRSSMDSHRPSMSAIMSGGGQDSARNSGEYTRPGEQSRRISNSSNANSIMADLAALQREVDEARQRGLS